jgi:hypothetical protein
VCENRSLFQICLRHVAIGQSPLVEVRQRGGVARVVLFDQYAFEHGPWVFPFALKSGVVFARYSIMVTIHFGVRAVAQEILGFFS